MSVSDSNCWATFSRTVLSKKKSPLFIPLGLWAVLKWFGSESANLMECWALYGYANLIWIPVALVSWSPLTGKFGFGDFLDDGKDCGC